MKGQFIIDDIIWNNKIMDNGIKKLGNILRNPSETNIRLIKISIGTDDSNDVSTRSSLVAEVGTKYDISAHSINSVYPFDLELTAVIPENQITRPTTIKEIGIWMGPVGSELLFARAIDSTGKVLNVNQSVNITYKLILV